MQRVALQAPFGGSPQYWLLLVTAGDFQATGKENGAIERWRREARAPRGSLASQCSMTTQVCSKGLREYQVRNRFYDRAF